MASMTSFPGLMERLRTGDDDAARRVFDRFALRLVGLAYRWLDRRIVHRVDPEDVVQSAFKSFFVRHRDGEFRLGDWGGLWGLLVLITLRKCADRAEHLRAARRDVRRESPLLDGEDQAWQLAEYREPRPEEAAALEETIEQLFRAVSDADRPILELSLQGYSSAEIARHLGRALRSVQRLREQVRRRLERCASESLRVGA